MTTFSKQQGKFKPDMFQPFDKLQIVTIKQILDGERMNLPLVGEVTKKAPARITTKPKRRLSANSGKIAISTATAKRT